METLHEKPVTTKDACGRYLSHHLRSFNRLTQINYKGVLSRFVEYAPDNITDITPEIIECFLSDLRENRKASSVNTYLVTIKSFFSWLETTDGIESPARKVKLLRESPPTQRVLCQDEYIKIVNSEYKRNYIPVFLCNTGLRASEFLSLTPQNINSRSLTIIGKGQKQRFVSLNKTVLNIIESKPFFSLIKSKSYMWLYRVCRKTAESAGIEFFGPHACRHYFCTALLQADVPLLKVSQMLGHASTQITEKIYTHLTEDDFAGVTDALPQVPISI